MLALLMVFFVFHSFIAFICIILFLCCCFCHKTKWSSCLHLVVLLLFFVVLFWICFFVFSFLSKKTPKKTGHSKNPQKTKMQKKRTKKKSVSAVVFTNSVLQFFGVGLEISLLAENTIKIVVSALFQEGKKSPTLTKLLSWKSVQGCVENMSN